jgi:multidrug efflux pump subunit AcrB
MVDAIHRRLQGDWEAESSQEIIIEAVTSRLRPIIVTTLTTLGGVLPMAYGLGGYDVFVAPMSMTIGWGMVFSTLVTLLLVPVLYAIARDLRRRFE